MTNFLFDSDLGKEKEKEREREKDRQREKEREREREREREKEREKKREGKRNFSCSVGLTNYADKNKKDREIHAIIASHI